MKAILITLTAAVLFFSTGNDIKAATANPLKNMNTTSIIAMYVETITTGGYALSKHLFTDDFEYKNNANSTSFNKQQYSKFLKQNQGLKYDCTTTYTVLDETGNSCVAKATMKFATFERVDYITLTRDQDSWKVSKVVTTYP